MLIYDSSFKPVLSKWRSGYQDKLKLLPNALVQARPHISQVGLHQAFIYAHFLIIIFLDKWLVGDIDGRTGQHNKNIHD